MPLATVQERFVSQTICACLLAWWCFCFVLLLLLRWDSLLVECRTRDGKVASLKPGRSSRGIFFSRVNFLCWLLFGVRSTPHVTTVACKRPQSFCQKCIWQVKPKHMYTLTQQSRSGLTMLLSRHSEETYQEMSSHAAHQGTLGYSHLSSMSHCEQISG